MNAYITYWPADWVKTILKNGDNGPLTVIYGGEHRSQPPLGKVGVGDAVYPVTLAAGQLYVMGRMIVGEIVGADEYTARLGIVREPFMWDSYTAEHRNTITHEIPRTCADDAAIGADGTPILMRPFPDAKTALIRLGPNTGKELPLKIQDGNISINNFSGYFRRMSEETKRIFDEVIREK